MDFSNKIAVGHDGSEESFLAVRWAAGVAAAADQELAVVHGWIWPQLTKQLGPVEGIPDSGLRSAADDLLREGVEAAREVAPEVRVGTALITGEGRTALGHVSRTADLVVVGHRGLGGFLGMLLGSVSLDLITHAGCPVAIIRTADAGTGDVVVGVDGSEAGLAAVGTAVRLAGTWRAPLRVVHVRRVINSRTAASDDEARDVLDQGVARARELGLTEVTGELVDHRSVSQGLLDAAGRARIIVVGIEGAGRRGFGSNAHAVMHHTTGNAVVTRYVARDEADEVEVVATD
ncbi:universal stress protein [Propionibacteriaceae bacterium Y2011]|uniref:universal stress protein n=1 Tax=Microlunatus sp. Y2014 TaxID=3418488 RepID=UPI003B4C91E4